MTRISMTIAAFGVLAFAQAGLAGEQFVDDTGFAVSGYDVVAYFDLPQAPVGSIQPEPEAGNAGITAEYNGATFAFASEENRTRFLENPAQYVPQYDGHCAYGVAKGGKVPGNPNLWRIVDGKLYLNITRNVVGFWEEDIPGNLNLSEANWPDLDPQPASDSPIPQFESPAPIR